MDFCTVHQAAARNLHETFQVFETRKVCLERSLNTHRSSFKFKSL